MPLNAGVIIIGSLLWDDDPVRETWRRERLAMDSTVTVTAPIRYGRRSGVRRGRTYTMVFSRSAQAGHATVVRCSRAITSSGDLIAEALRLWEAEELSAKRGRIAANWGCVALMCNPEREIPPAFLRTWAERVNSEQGYGTVSQKPDEGRLISEGGLLQIGWPRCTQGGGAVDLDLLLVTANDPTLTGTPLSYPSVETMVDAWNSADQKHAEYFWKNIDNSITTFQDDEIRAALRPRQQAPA